VLLVWLVLAVWVTDLGHDVVLLVEDVVTDTEQVSPLQVYRIVSIVDYLEALVEELTSVEVDLDNTVGDGIRELLLGGTRSTVEDEEDWLVVLGTDLLLDVQLVLAEKLWVQLDVTWLVDTVDVTETSGDGEVWGNWGESVVDSKDILWLSVKGVVVNILVVDTILLTTSDTDLLGESQSLFAENMLNPSRARSSPMSSLGSKKKNQIETYHLEPLLHWGSTLKVLSGGLNVEVDLLLGEIDHVRREKWLAVLSEVLLISVEKTVQPWEELLGTVVSVEDDWNAVGWGNSADVVSASNTTSDGSLLVTVGNTLRTVSTINGPRMTFFSIPFRRSKRHHPGTSGG
jgi:hypothetical protein